MTKESKIAAVIISRNEERNIARCIDSLMGVADEIIVIDSFSEDNTPEICRSRGVKFVQTEWKGYSATKNYGNSLATCDYILSLDADEALSDALHDEIITLKKKGFDFNAYRVKRLTNYCGSWIRHCGWYPDWKLRIFKKDLGNWEGVIHEEVKFGEEVRSGSLRNDLLHYSYYSFSEHFQQMTHFTNIMAMDYFQRDKRPARAKLVFSPIIKFFKAYFLQGGFRDGYHGFIVCSFSAMATFMKYAKAIQLFRERECRVISEQNDR